MKPSAQITSIGQIHTHIITLRNQSVILDTELASVYQVEVRSLLQAVKRNPKRFPLEFIFQLSPQEITRLRSQFVISKPARGGRRYAPFAFTEHGALMAATVLNSPRAVKMSLYLIKAFIRMREEQVSNSAILKRLAEIDKTLLVHDAALSDIYHKLLPLLQPPAQPPKPEIGYHTLQKRSR